MGMVVMSKRELNRLDVLVRLDSDKLTARAAAELMAVTMRQTYRLLRRYRDSGVQPLPISAAVVPRTTACRMWFAIMRLLWCGSGTQTLDRHSRPRSWQSVMISRFRGRRCAAG